jgi:hypothetical protein
LTDGFRAGGKLESLEQAKAERESRQWEFVKRLLDWATREVDRNWIGDYARSTFLEVKQTNESMRTDVISRHRSAAIAWALKLHSRIICKLASYAGKHNDTSDWEETRRWILEASDYIWHRLFTLDVDLEWFQFACDPPPHDRLKPWRAPTWLDSSRLARVSTNDDSEPQSTIPPGRSSVKATQQLVKWVKGREGAFREACANPNIKECLILLAAGQQIPDGFPLPAGLDTLWTHAEKELTIPSKLQRGVRPKGAAEKERIRVVRDIIRKHPELKGPLFCRQLDNRGVTVPITWQAGGCAKSFVDAYKQSKSWRHCINQMKSKIQKEMP